MKSCFYIFLGILGTCYCLTGFAQEEFNSNLSYSDKNQSEFQEVVSNDEDKINTSLMRCKLRRYSSKSFTLFQADLTRCSIGINDRCLLANGGVDFVTHFNGNDFSCRVLRRGGIEITPQNGSSFQLAVPPVPEPGPVPGGAIDHVKFLAYSLFEDLPVNKNALGCHEKFKGYRQLCSTWVASGKQLNVENNPFGQFTPRPKSDPRLACFCLISLNPRLLTAFDWICTDEVIYALVERLPGGEQEFGNYAAYIYLIPVFHRKQSKDPLKDIHTFQICYDSNGTAVTWILDGQSVFKITEIGHRLTENNAFVFKKGKPKPLSDPSRFQTMDNGGVDQTVVLDGIQTGIALLTFLDYYAPATHLNVTREERLNSGIYEGLVRLESNVFRPATNDFFYKNPLTGQVATFFQNSSIDPLNPQQFLPIIPSTFRIFGQGAVLRLFEYSLSLEE